MYIKFESHNHDMLWRCCTSVEKYMYNSESINHKIDTDIQQHFNKGQYT